MMVDRRQALLRRQSIIKTLGFVGVILGVLAMVVVVENLLISTVLAIVISYLIGPAVSSIERMGVSRALAATFLFLVITVVIAWAITWLIPLIGDQLATARADFPKYLNGLSELISNSEKKLTDLAGGAFQVDLSQQIQEKMAPKASSFFEHLPNLISKLLTTMVLAPFIAFFLIKDGRQVSRGLLSLVPNPLFETMLNLFHQINEQMGQFVRARMLEAGIVGFVTWIGLFAIGFPFSTFLAIFAALTNLIPYVGPIIGAVPAIVIALINGEPSLQLFLVIFVYFIAQLIDTLFIIPLVVAKIVDLHPVTVVVAIALGYQVLGVVGMLISIPVASVLKVTLSTVYRLATDARD